MKDLPLEIILTAQDSGFEMSDELADKFSEEIAEWLSDKYGYLVEGYDYKIELSNILWDIGE